MGKDCNRRGFRSTNFLYVVILCLLLSPATGFAQTKRINLELKNVTVQEAVTSLNRTENYSILVSSDEVDLNKRISVSAQNATIREILDQVFAGQEVNCTINGNRIIVTKRQSAPMAETPTAPDDSVYGRVTDTKGQPIIAATVTIEGSQKGTLTGADGTFELTEVTFPAQLNISYLGYITQTATIEQGGGNLPLNIVLKESDNLMDEVVVVGYGTQRRANLSGAVATISGKDLNARPVVSAANALQGADPSVNITFGTGSPESSYSINIRGSISLNNGSPLVLADGVEVSLSQINPNDIESVSVLKDASSCAIYGAKASAGVVLITTKAGKKGQRAHVTYNGRFGWAKNTTSTDFIDTGYDHVRIVNQFMNDWTFSATPKRTAVCKNSTSVATTVRRTPIVHGSKSATTASTITTATSTGTAISTTACGRSRNTTSRSRAVRTKYPTTQAAVSTNSTACSTSTRTSSTTMPSAPKYRPG